MTVLYVPVPHGCLRQLRSFNAAQVIHLSNQILPRTGTDYAPAQMSEFISDT